MYKTNKMSKILIVRVNVNKCNKKKEQDKLIDFFKNRFNSYEVIFDFINNDILFNGVTFKLEIV